MQSQVSIRSVFVHRLAVLVAITAVALIPFSVGAQTDRFWQGPPGGQWDVSANWTLGAPGFPNAAGDGALNIQTITTSTTQATAGGVTVGKIGHDATNNTSWTITATTAITLNNLGAGAIVRNTDTSTGGSNQLIILGVGGLTLADNLNITNTGGSTASSSINLDTVIRGTGNITISNVSNSFANGNGAVFLQRTNTFVGNTTIGKGLTKFNDAKAFSTGQINLGQTGLGDASLLSTQAINAANNIVVAAGTGGTSLLGSSTSGTATYSGLITLNGNVTLTNLNSGGGGTTAYSNTISGNGGVRVIGPGTALLSHANTFVGSTTVDSGTLKAGATDALGSTSSVTVNSTGTLLLSGSSPDRINNAATITLAGGTFNTGGLSEGTATNGGAGVGALTLTLNSTIDFGAGSSSIIQFAGLGPHIPTSGPDLAITNWNGVPQTGGSGDRLLFSGSTSAFMSQYSQSDVLFNGTAGYNLVQFSGFYEVTAAPEPSTWAAAALTLAVLAWTQRRRFGRSRALPACALGSQAGD